VPTSARRAPGLPGPITGDLAAGVRTDDMWPNRANPVSPSVIGASGLCRGTAALPFGEATRVVPDACCPVSRGVCSRRFGGLRDCGEDLLLRRPDCVRGRCRNSPARGHRRPRRYQPRSLGRLCHGESHWPTAIHPARAASTTFRISAIANFGSLAGTLCPLVTRICWACGLSTSHPC